MKQLYKRPSGLVVPTEGFYLPAAQPKVKKRTRPTGVDLFCGCGGFSLGIIQGGFEVVAACDADAAASITYMANLGTYPIEIHYLDKDGKDRLDNYFQKLVRTDKETGLQTMPISGGGWISGQQDVPGVEHFFFGDIRKLTGEMILDAVGLELGELDVVFGGPPCQGFSKSGKRNVMDPRNSLVFDFARLVLELQPKTMIMENVPGITTMVTPEGLPVIDAFCRILSDGGFGHYEALKRSIAGKPDVKVAMKGMRDRQEPDEDAESEETSTTEQLTMF